MERFNYPSLKAMRRERVELLHLLDCESYGDKMDEKEEIERLRAEAQNDR